jgi:thiol:disulfide interchange protein DsbD
MRALKKHSYLNILFLIFSFIYGISSANAETTYLTASKARAPHITVSLISEHQTITPNSTFYVGVLLEPDEQWHTYWRNPGDSGEAPKIEITSQTNISVGEIEWPIPKAIPVAHLTNYGYEGATLLMLPIEVKNLDNPSAELTLNASLSWLVCKEDCIPGWADLTLSLLLSDEAAKSSQSDMFERTRLALPMQQTLNGKHELSDSHIVVELDTSDINDFSAKSWTLFPFRSDAIQHSAEQTITGDNAIKQWLIPKSDYLFDDPKELKWLLSNGEQAFYLDTSVNQTLNLSTGAFEATSLWLYLLMAFIGGLILNIMPCVLPILSMKAMALQQKHESLGQKWAYLLGVLISFNLFALVIYVLQQTGQAVGWGFHMQEPLFIVLLSFLFTFIALALFDVFEMASGLAGFGQHLVEGNTAKSHFFTGVLAVVVASPCTAPFMAAALGVALVSDAYVSFAIFNALALGFALPITLLFISSRLKAFLPKPGAWMQTFKQALAFPMLATVAWLVWVYLGQTNAVAQFLLILSLISFAMFTWGLSKSSSSLLRVILILGVLASIAVPLFLLNPQQANTASNTAQSAENYVPYDQNMLDELKQKQEVVFVNMTADWCITCKVNESVALSKQAVLDKFEAPDVHYMLGDWTNKNQAILDYLKQYQRAGVPLYVVYAGEKHVNVLPQVLTPSIVIDAIEQAKQELNND